MSEDYADQKIAAPEDAGRQARPGPAPRTDEGPLADRPHESLANQRPDPGSTDASESPMYGAEALMNSPRHTMHPPAPAAGTFRAPPLGQPYPVQEVAEGKTYGDGTEVMPRGERERWGQRRWKLPHRTPRAGFRNFIANDVPGRLDQLKRRGYRHVVDEKGLPVKDVVDKATGVLGYLMEIPIEFYNEDFADKQQLVDATDMAMLHESMTDGGYRPRDPYSNRPVTQMNVVRGREPG